MILRLDNVSFRYKDASKDDYVLRNINLSFKEGKSYAIKVKSGSGKTTLLSLISGLENCYEGSIYFNDFDLKKIDLDKYRSHDIGIIFQQFNLLPYLTSLENVILSMDISHYKGNKKERAFELLNMVGLSKDEASRRVLRLSGGQQQRVAIARCLSFDPKVIIADEPTGNLDEKTEYDILHILNDLAHKENKCVIIFTHWDNVSNSVNIIYKMNEINNA